MRRPKAENVLLRGSLLVLRILLWALLGVTLGGCSITPEQARERYPESLFYLEQGVRRCGHRSETFEQASRRAHLEEQEAAASLFAAMAYAEQVQQRHYAVALRHLAGGFRPPRKRTLYIASTTRNLQQLLAEPTTPAYHDIESVLGEGNRYVARLMIRDIASRLRQQRAAEQLLFAVRRPTYYRVCPACGYLSDDLHADPYCPQCLLSGARFRCFVVEVKQP